MITNDHILTLMIAKDMFSRKVANYQLKDEVVTDPKQIKVGANEVVYVCYCYVEASGDFTLQLESGTDLVAYRPKNTVKQELSQDIAYHSSQITSHWSTIKITPKQTGYYYIRYIRVTTQIKPNENEES